MTPALFATLWLALSDDRSERIVNPSAGIVNIIASHSKDIESTRL
jgi:hypothetical protein